MNVYYTEILEGSSAAGTMENEILHQPEKYVR